MFKFNNNHIFTGYLKQLLASFNLPKCKVYTKEQRKYAETYKIRLNEWSTELTKLSKRQTAIEDDLREIAALIKASSDDEYLTTLNAVKATYSEELAGITSQINDLQAKITNTPKELNVIQTIYHSTYARYPNSVDGEDLPTTTLKYSNNLRYISYLKDGRLQVYADGQWKDCHSEFDVMHQQFHEVTGSPYAIINYSYGQKLLNYTKNLKIQNTVYDSYTHEYLGDYLRFQRDFLDINLMSLYNCFSNRACPHLDISFDLTNKYKAIFKTDQSFETTLYKYYMVPVKFFKNYTIAIDSCASIEVCCCIYDEYHNKDVDFSELPKLTYQCFSDLQFKAPVCYSKLQNLTSLVLNQDLDLCQHEADLKLILKIPATNKSSIVILEGDYTTYNDLAHPKTATDLGILKPAELELLLTPSLIQAHQDHIANQPGVKYSDTCKICEILKRLEAAKEEATEEK